MPTESRRRRARKVKTRQGPAGGSGNATPHSATRTSVIQPFNSAPIKQPIVIAFGVQFRDLGHVPQLRDYLNSIATQTSPDTFEYSHGRSKFEIHIVFTKQEFADALDIPNAIVVYDGHSRRGQGPAFDEVGGAQECESRTPTPWENHFRMGYDAVDIPCLADIIEHCTNPLEHNRSSPHRFVGQPVEHMLAAGSGRSLPREVAETTNGLGVQTLASRHYWSRRREEGTNDYVTIVQVGSANLNASGLRCKLLFLNSCSSRVHYHRALRRRKEQTRSQCKFFLTNRTAYMAAAQTTYKLVRFLLNGKDPRNRGDRRVILRSLNADPSLSGRIGFYR